MLIETHGADVNAQDNSKDTPLHNALRSFNQNGGDISVLHYFLNKQDLNANLKCKYDHTLLHLACDNINNLPLDIFKLLIETHGADINAKNKYDDTPLHCAFRYFKQDNGGDINVLNYLLSQKGVDPNIKGQFGYTLLHGACIKINDLPLDMFKLLIETHGADVNAQDNNEDTPLHNAIRDFNANWGGDINVLTYLINQQTVDVNIKDQNGYALLHTACISNLSSMRSVELKAECDTISCQIVEVIVERYLEHVLDDTTF
jgi:cytohesin